MALEEHNVEFDVATKHPNGEHCAFFSIPFEYISHASSKLQGLYMDFYQCWMDMKDIGIDVESSPMPINSEMHISLTTHNPQIIMLFEDYKKMKEMKSSSTYDEEDYQRELNDILNIFDVPISEYLQP